MLSSKTHYETLGLTESATKADVKSAFRSLSKKYHPDLAGDGAHNLETFKRISAAHSVLSNDLERRRYDIFLSQSVRSFDGSGTRAEGFHPRHDASSQSGRAFRGIPVRPTLIVAGIFMGLGIVSMLNNKEKVERSEKMVEAWLNPRTNQWEIPAPYDPVYRKTKPELHFVPRSQVRRSR